MYLGPLNLIISNTEKKFISKKFKEYANIINIYIKVVLIKAYNSIGIVEQYYSM